MRSVSLRSWALVVAGVAFVAPPAAWAKVHGGDVALTSAAARARQVRLVKIQYPPGEADSATPR